MNSGDQYLFKKGRGAQIKVPNRFDMASYEALDEFKEHQYINDEDPIENARTSYIKVFPKTIVNKVTSPDVPLEWSMNPYQGCEHGCTYCYARNTHDFWGYNAGTDFEQKILVKENAPALLEAFFQKPTWKPQTIMLSGNTDCYQPAERQFKITRELLKLCLKYRNPIGIITKNTLVIRDLDLLTELAQRGLVQVVFSITSLDEGLRTKLEPRTASSAKKLNAIATLTEHSVPSGVMMAPIIPGLNSHEVFDIAKATAGAGALSFHHTMVRLNGAIGDIFLNWLQWHYPDRAEKVKNLIEETHGGSLSDSQFGKRMRGEGNVAHQVSNMVKLARKKFFEGRAMPPYDYSQFIKTNKGQTSLFG